ncbi:MAG: cell surface protein SprA [Flavobacteriaceae bacterium]
MGVFCSISVFAQRTKKETADLGQISLPPAAAVSEIYQYDPDRDVYYLAVEIDGYPITTPMILTPKEYEALILKESLKTYFKEKTETLTGKAENLKASQKNLLPELYVNNQFFQTIFGSNAIDIKPQGSIGVDFGGRYQRNDNPIASPTLRRNFSFDFDQRISLSLIGNIGERLQITANYDTESTFDFQNLVKIQFNPPKLTEAVGIAQSGALLETAQELKGKFDQAKSTVADLKSKAQQAKAAYERTRQSVEKFQSKIQNYAQDPSQLGTKVTDYLNGKVTEDGIIQNIDLGNISMPINNSLIQGAQSLFGVRTDLKFGKTNITAVFSEQRSQSQNITAQGGGRLSSFSVFALDYEEDRHYFLSQYFRDHYDTSLQTYPYINSPVQITRIEVWITNRSAQTQNIRNIIALQDLGEASPANTTLDDKTPDFFTAAAVGGLPHNAVNRLDPKAIGGSGLLTEAVRDIATVQAGFGTLSNQVQEGFDYAVLESARKLQPNEYQFHPQLGYISLNQRLSNDEVLAVAFQYTYAGKVYQVGEFANGDVASTEILVGSGEGKQQVQNNNLVVKMLKSNLTNVKQPVWDLMMKNIYNTGAFQLAEDEFRLSILYTDPSPINYMSPVDSSQWPDNLEEQILLNTFQLDRLNNYQDPLPQGDGFFDFIPGITIDPQYGRIIFPTVEPFGSFLFDLLQSEKTQADYDQPATYNPNQKKYVFREMYALTKAAALEATEKNKFELKGRYKSEGGEGIPIGAFNVPRGSVRVTAGGRILQEGVDYTVNYDIGRVIIIDEGLKSSNVPVEISVENNSFFNQQNKRFSGFNLQHQVDEKVVLGATLLNLSENPLTQKANYGTEPVNNTMLGFNTNFSTELPFLTRLVSRLPGGKTEAPSRISFRGEIASLRAGNPRNTQLQGEATVYVDDFEGAQTTIDVKGFTAWKLASVPAQNYKGAEASSGLATGLGRAKLAWYTLDPVFWRNRPAGINNNDVSLNTTRRITIQEIFPEQDLVQGTTTIQNTLDLAYYPTERGPYNNSTAEDFAKQPQENWAGITRALAATNFEQSNVEFIEFWLLDTFNELEGQKNELGELVFHLGNISEDILKDGRKQYENGLPGTDESALVYNTEWGEVPATQSLLYAFNTVPEDRPLQDVGLDGLSDAQEAAIYTNGPPEDPAGDNYTYFLAADGGILERYKNYNGTEGNSPIDFSNTDRGSNTEPDTEDINRDQSMNTIDSYFEYRVPITRDMTVGNHPFVTDVRENVKVEVPNGDEITTRWIQFKVPVQKGYYQGTAFQNYFDAINSIEDLRSIRFMRMLLSGFDQPVVFRFGTLELVRGDWRRYLQQLNPEISQNPNTTVDISTVNILENENRIPVNYVLPPDIVREQVNTNNTIVRQNEQSLAFRVCDLQPQDARAIFKSVDVDMRQYKKLHMYLHAESIPGQIRLPGEGNEEAYDRRLVAFIRLGTDYQDNYYQIEVPLKPTSYEANESNQLTPEEVWQPESNSIEVTLEQLSALKAKALQAVTLGKAAYFDENLNPVQEFSPVSSLPGTKKYRFSVKGNPSLGSIKTLMIGVKNPSTQVGDVLCGEVWFNELRIAGIDSEGGWAAVGALDANMANFASLSATGRYSSIGFGGIDQSPNNSNREELLQYNMVSNLSVGQLFPQKWGIQAPLNISMGETIITPEFDPYYQDLELETRLESTENPGQKDRIRQQAIDYTKRKSISVIGLRKQSATSGKSRFYSPENFDLSYAYNEQDHQDFEVEKLRDINLLLAANYGHTFQSFEINPFQKIKGLQSKQYWEWLRQVNFSPLPNAIGFTSNINRRYRNQKFREVFLEGVDASQQLALPELQQRNFLVDWSYTITHNITRSLRMNLTASSNNIVRKPFQVFEQNKDLSSPYNRNVWDELWNLGESNLYNQSLVLNYKLPLRYIPFLSFIDANYNYTGNFNWQRGSDALAQVVSPEGIPLGVVHTVQNANTKSLAGSISFSRLYAILGLKKGTAKFSPLVQRRLAAKQAQNKGQDSEEKKEKDNNLLKTLVDGLSTFKRIQFNYSENNGKVLPGYLQGVGGFGTLDPSFGFTLGSQEDVRYEMAKRGHLTAFPNFNEPFTQVHNSKLTLSTQFNPFKDFIVDINAERSYSENIRENFQVENQEYVPLNSNTFGNFGMSTVLIKTAFNRTRGVTNASFDVFRANRYAIAERLAQASGIPTADKEGGYPKGFGKDQQNVLIAAFLSAYTDTAPSKVRLDPIYSIPLPNWNLKYTGLSSLKALKNIFNRFSIAHAYRASHTVNNFQTNLDFDPQNPFATDNAGNIIPERLYSNINLVEQFNPLLRLDVEFKNSLKILAELKRDRALSLSLDNSLLTESSGNEYIVGMGYRIKDLRIRTSLNGRRTTLAGDLNIKADLSYRRNITVLRNLDYNNNQVTAGQTLLSIKLTADYNLSRNLTTLFFYDHNFSKFEVSTAFPQTSIRSGFTLRYNFGN